MKRILTLSLIAGLLASTAAAQVTAQWRGPARDGIYPEKNLLQSWPAQGPSLLWKLDIVGNGYGSPTITEDRIYICGEIDTTAWLFAFDLKGNLQWKTACGKEWVESYEGARCAPTVAGDLIYVCSGLGNLVCVDAKSGAIKWSVDMRRDLHGRFTRFGHAESPLVSGNRVFLVPGGKDTNVVAFDRFTGKILWICKGTGEIPGYNAPYLIRLAKREIVVTFSAYTLMGIDAATGELLWTHEQVNTPKEERKPGNGDTHSNTVLYENGFIYYVAGDGNGAVKLALSEDGKTITQVWRNKAIDNYMGGIVKQGNRIYSCLSERRRLISLDAQTGQVTDSLKCGVGAVILADGMLYYYNQRGEFYLIRPGVNKMEIISMFGVIAGTKEHFSHPVIRDGVLYLRHGKVFMAWDIRRK